MSRNSFYRKSFEIVGYTYDADVHCVDCTCKYIKAGYPCQSSIEHDDYQGFGNWGMDVYGEKFLSKTFEDSEGNEIHPLFVDNVYLGDLDDEDAPDEDSDVRAEYCGDCGERIG